jgi:ribosomal protein S18 acetylase RimI-like enzyme
LISVEVVTYYLEMREPDDLRPSRASVEQFEVRQAQIPCPELNRFLYTAVGGDWFWVDRLTWTYREWLEYLDRPEHETWVGYIAGTPAGYFELELQDGANVELVYFGLLPQFVGRGIGGLLLTASVERAWQMGAQRVWLHTCTLDAPTALRNYEARGFRVYKQERAEKHLPEETPGAWPGVGFRKL